MSSQYLILTRWMSRRGLLKSLGRCCLGLVALSTGGWRCRWGAPSLPQLPPATTKTPPPYISVSFFFCSDGSDQHKFWTAGSICVYLGSGVGRAIWEQFYFQLFQESGDFACMVIRLLLPISMETTHNPKEPVLLIALKIMRHAKLCCSVILFLICVCWHPERMCWALSTCGQRGQV